MTRGYDLEAMVVHLEAVQQYSKQYFDAHFISEVEHLISTEKANQEE